LSELAKGEPAMWRTRAARAVLQRLDKSKFMLQGGTP
jgi:hypothetical protein